MLEGHVIHGLSCINCPYFPLNPSLATQYWTENNIADGLTALATCIEVISLALSRYGTDRP